ncbi:MAG: D-aminoacyl-tRNA deacylase [Candidatus Omnitrophota bacterium]
MKAVLQRVKEAFVCVDKKEISRVKTGLLILLGAEKTDTEKDADYLSSKILKLRVFEDENKKMNYSISE